MAGQQADIILKQFEKISLFVQFQRRYRFLHIICRQNHIGILEPDKVILVTAECHMFVQTLQNEPLVFCIEFRRNYVKDFVDIEFFSFVPVITGYIDLVQI